MPISAEFPLRVVRASVVRPLFVPQRVGADSRRAIYIRVPRARGGGGFVKSSLKIQIILDVTKRDTGHDPLFPDFG